MPGLLSATYPLFGLATATATAPGVSGTINCGEYREGQLVVQVTGKAGSVSKLRPAWQTSGDGLSWVDHSLMGTFSNATGVKVLPLSTIGKYGRLRYLVSGTAAAVKFQATFIGKW